ncbi:MAG TPA: TonB family protein [Pyrinomonadaceae bacterium]|nr:TonB family protein [Pyrinomonadaceae bacterium]
MQNFIISKNFLTQKRKGAKAQSFYKIFFASWHLCAFVLIFFSYAKAQKIAVIAPEKNVQSETFIEKLVESLSKKYKILDSSLSDTAFRSANFETPFNLTTTESKLVSSAIGCNYFLLVRTENQRRASLTKNDYFEASAAIFVVSSLTGRLVFWKLELAEGKIPNDANKQLFASTDKISAEISSKLNEVGKDELSEKPTPNIIELPDENSTEAKGLRPPLPFRRIKPEYTSTASLYGIKATVDIEIEVSETGKIIKTEIVRWAGYGLDESVREAIYKMQWRPADRNGKTLPLRVLLRYNFKKIEKED